MQRVVLTRLQELLHYKLGNEITMACYLSLQEERERGGRAVDKRVGWFSRSSICHCMNVMRQTWGVEWDLKTFMSSDVPSPNASPSPMLATNKYTNLPKTSNTVPAFNSSLPSNACMRIQGGPRSCTRLTIHYKAKKQPNLPGQWARTFTKYRMKWEFTPAKSIQTWQVTSAIPHSKCRLQVGVPAGSRNKQKNTSFVLGPGCWAQNINATSSEPSQDLLWVCWWRSKCCCTWTALRRATEVASLMTPSPKTREYRRGILSCFKTCRTATLSVAAKITPRARQSCTWHQD